MSNRARKNLQIVTIVLYVIALVALAVADIISKGSLTTGFFGMAVLLTGAILIPNAIDLIKGRKK